MISYKFPEERDYLYFFCGQLSDTKVVALLNGEAELNADMAQYLSEFFWRMVDKSILVEKEGKFPWPDGAEFWNEKLLYSISGYLEKSGFGDVWDTEVDKQ